MKKFIIKKSGFNVYYCSQHKKLTTTSLNAASKYATFDNAFKALQKSGLNQNEFIIEEKNIPQNKAKQISA
jgi:hypothetical protein